MLMRRLSPALLLLLVPGAGACLSSDGHHSMAAETVNMHVLVLDGSAGSAPLPGATVVVWERSSGNPGEAWKESGRQVTGPDGRCSFQLQPLGCGGPCDVRIDIECPGYVPWTDVWAGMMPGEHRRGEYRLERVGSGPEAWARSLWLTTRVLLGG